MLKDDQTTIFLDNLTTNLTKFRFTTKDENNIHLINDILSAIKKEHSITNTKVMEFNNDGNKS